MKILITGSAGFIGFHLAKKILELGETVVGIDNINDYYSTDLKYARLAEAGISREAENWHQKIASTSYPNYSFIRMNLEDREELNQLFATGKFDIVCNLAAQAGVRYSIENPHAYIQSNLVGFANILEAGRLHKIKHLIYASSSSVYGNNHKVPFSETDNVDHPISLYAATKKSNELMAHTYSHLYGLPTTGLRFFTVYGPWGRPDMAPILFAEAITNNKPIKVFNNGNLERDFTYIDDITEGILRIINNPPYNKNKSDFSPLLWGDASVRTGDGRQRGSDHNTVQNKIRNPEQLVEKPHTQNPVPYSIYNIGKGHPIKLLDFIETMEGALNKKARKEFLPMQAGDVYKTFADLSELKKNFGYFPRTTIEKGIRGFVDWYNGYYQTQ